jgi:hypothetical protein
LYTLQKILQGNYSQALSNFNEPVDFLAQVAFPAFGGTPEIFRILGGC